MASHEDLMFQFDSGSAAEEDPLQRMPDLESQQGDNYTTPRAVSYTHLDVYKRQL